MIGSNKMMWVLFGLVSVVASAEAGPRAGVSGVRSLGRGGEPISA